MLSTMSRKLSFLGLIFSLLILFSLFYIPVIKARTTPEDIVNAQKTTYEQKVKNYAPDSKKKLDQYYQKIADLNKKATDSYEDNMVRQAQILDEYVRRNPNKNSSDVENARYWLTFAHEAVAFQAGKIYIFDLSGESFIKSDINSTISNLESDLSTLKAKVAKSQNIIKSLVTKK